MRVIFIYGPAAAGKYTVGKALAEATGIALFHNHLTVDLALSLFEFGSEPFVELREAIWLNTFRIAASTQKSLIFTFHPEATVRTGFIDETKKIVTAAGGIIDFVALRCAEDALLKRMGNEDRAQFGKLTDSDLYCKIRDQGGFDFPDLPMPSVTVATDQTSPEDAAQQIQEALGL